VGCDIHFYIEKRRDKTEPWIMDEHHVAEHPEDNHPHIPDFRGAHRNYEMFYIMAGVRRYGDENQLFSPRGMPDDMDPILKKASDGEDWHSHSWLSIQEFERCLLEYHPPNYNIALDLMKSDDNRYDNPTDYDEILVYAHKWLVDEQVENTLLNIDKKPEVRFVFWFDN